MRSATPGILLNWAYYYKNWPAQQADPNLYKAIHISPQISNFAQAHFFLEEHQLLEKFPGCKVIQLVVDDESNLEIYWQWLYHKLLNKRMHRAWHDRYLKFAPLNNSQTQATLANMCKDNILRIRHYWSAWYIDNLGMDLNLVPNPFQYWLERRYIQDFHPNLKSLYINNQKAQQITPPQNVLKIAIDKIWPLWGTAMDPDLYVELCESTGLQPNFDLVQRFWQWWRPQQPDPSKVHISTNWL